MRTLTLGLLSSLGLVLAAASAAAADDAAVQKLLDRAEIEELVARYVHALDTHDADAYASVFAEDAVYETPMTTYRGRAEVRKLVTDLEASRVRNEAEGRPTPRLYHVMSNSSIEILDATNARHKAYAQTVRAADNGQIVVGFMGRYEDVLVKRGGRWVIQTRKLVSFVPNAAPPAPASR